MGLVLPLAPSELLGTCLKVCSLGGGGGEPCLNAKRLVVCLAKLGKPGYPTLEHLTPHTIPHILRLRWIAGSSRTLGYLQRWLALGNRGPRESQAAASVPNLAALYLLHLLVLGRLVALGGCCKLDLCRGTFQTQLTQEHATEEPLRCKPVIKSPGT